MTQITIDVDALAQEIRRVDGNHSLAAGALAEALIPFLSTLPIAGEQEAQKREALLRAERITAPEDDHIRELCERIGYGAVMDSAARQWAKKDPIGAFYIGGCIGSAPSSPGKDGGQEVEAGKRIAALEHDLAAAEGRAKNAMSDLQYWRGQYEAISTQPASTALVEISGITLRTDNTKSYGQDVVVFACMPDGREIEVIRSFGALPEVTIHHHVTYNGIRAALSSSQSTSTENAE